MTALPGNERLASIAAALVLIIGMGFGRFAFTGLYPLMVTDGQISVEGGSYAASANYAGYLVGALLAGFVTGISSRMLCAFSALATVVSLALLGLPLSEWLIVTIRGLAGVFSAIAMVAASQWLIHDRGHHHGAPALFAGVGVGILMSAEIIAAGHLAAMSSRAIWTVLAVTALALAMIAITMQRRSGRSKPATSPSYTARIDSPTALGSTRLIVVYALAGFGYIITATYLPLLVRDAFSSIDPAHLWAIFGLGAIPSCFLWHSLHERLGTARSLSLNLLVQSVGVALPVLNAPTAYIASALLVGGTFMGTVTIAMPAARRIAAMVKENTRRSEAATRFNILSIMTAAYGVGQIAGPLAAGALYAQTGSFNAALLIASGALLLATGMCIEGSIRRVE